MNIMDVHHGLNRRTVRAPVNPLDKATIVSIYPRDIVEVKHTIQPGLFQIPAGTYAKPSVLVVGPSSWWREFEGNQPLLEIPQSAVVIAESVIKDYCNGLFRCDMGSSMPGLFYISGEHGSAKILKDFRPALDEANSKQRNWYKSLVESADVLWVRSQGNPLAISDDMKLAARELGQETKDWLKNQQVSELVKCIACGNLRNPEYPICPLCKAIADPVKAKELGLQFAS